MIIQGQDAEGKAAQGCGLRGETGYAARRTSRLVVAVCAVVCAAAWSSAPASASSQRGHAFAFAFGGPESSDGQLSSPSSVAVDEASGEVYVSDSANNRVDQFEPERERAGDDHRVHLQARLGLGRRGRRKAIRDLRKRTAKKD